MRAISIKLTDHLDRRLTAIARRRRSNRSAVLREALEAFEKRTPKESVTAAASDLVGSLRGPADLSISPKHMAGYGR
jgi:Arc/MetJ-type ribon-helix-helix transcriptional regulator